MIHRSAIIWRRRVLAHATRNHYSSSARAGGGGALYLAINYFLPLPACRITPLRAFVALYGVARTPRRCTRYTHAHTTPTAYFRSRFDDISSSRVACDGRLRLNGAQQDAGGTMTDIDIYLSRQLSTLAVDATRQRGRPRLSSLPPQHNACLPTATVTSPLHLLYLYATCLPQRGLPARLHRISSWFALYS